MYCSFTVFQAFRCTSHLLIHIVVRGSGGGYCFHHYYDHVFKTHEGSWSVSLSKALLFAVRVSEVRGGRRQQWSQPIATNVEAVSFCTEAGLGLCFPSLTQRRLPLLRAAGRGWERGGTGLLRHCHSFSSSFFFFCFCPIWKYTSVIHIIEINVSVGLCVPNHSVLFTTIKRSFSTFIFIFSHLFSSLS